MHERILEKYKWKVMEYMTALGQLNPLGGAYIVDLPPEC